MSEFAGYVPVRPPGAVPATAVHIDEARPDDLASVAGLTARREHATPEQCLQSIESRLVRSPHECRLFVARLRSEVVAFGWASWIEVSSLPTGWYLSGLVVSPAHRRRGIGRALTEHRVRWLSSRTDSVYYFANLRNRATIDLHAALGFQEVRRNISVPGCSFEGGIGVLYLLRPSPRRTPSNASVSPRPT